MKIKEVYNLRERKGEVGIEVEIEGINLPRRLLVPWKVTTDGSLRGEGFEYVLSKPVQRNKIEDALKILYSSFEDSTLIPSDRTGVHIHINCQELTFIETMNFACLYLIFEDLLIRYCGEARRGNLFCLGAADADFLIKILCDAMILGNFNEIGQNDNFRYSSLNLTPISRYGSLEFRSLSTPEDVREIQQWAEILLQLKDASATFKSISEMVETLSHRGPWQFAADVLGPHFKILECPELENMLYDGIRRVQNIAYITPPKTSFKAKTKAEAVQSFRWNAPPLFQAPEGDIAEENVSIDARIALDEVQEEEVEEDVAEEPEYIRNIRIRNRRIEMQRRHRRRPE